MHSEDSFGVLTVDVPPEQWVEALTFARDELGCGFFDWLTAVDELEEGFGIVAHVYSLREGAHLLVRTRVPRADPVCRPRPASTAARTGTSGRRTRCSA